LHCAIAAQTDVVTFHTHTARAVLPAMSGASMLAAVTGVGEPCGVWPDAVPVQDGVVTGRLAGGNVALLASLCGTRNAMMGDGAVVVLEDIGEAAYRVDRMFRQLEQAGAFEGCVGLAVGQFTQVPDDENADALTIAALVAELAERLRIPCLANLPIGHIADQWTIPLGATATLDVAGRSLTVGMDVTV
jgi:muramoyltetrapeptide carboxypeptidase